MTVSVSPSILGSYHYWRGEHYSEEQEQAALESLVAQIKGEPFEPTEPMLLGRAFHEALERTPVASVVTVDYPEHGFTATFDAEDLERFRLPPGATQELRGELELPEIDVVMRCRVDAIHGTEVHEYKTTTKSISKRKAERYMTSYQWRCYLLAFGCQSAAYHLVRLKRDRGSGVYEVADYAPMTMYRYENMWADVVREVWQLLAFMEQQGLTDYRRVNAAKGA